MYEALLMYHTIQILLVAFWLLCWLLTFIIGASKGTGCSSAIVGVLGPIGLIVVILDHGNKIKCPFCQEYIDRKARLCPKCRSEVDFSKHNKARTKPQYYKFSRSTPNNITSNSDQTPYYSNDSGIQYKEQDGQSQFNIEKKILNSLNLEKYGDIEYKTLRLIRKALEDSVLQGTNLKHDLSMLSNGLTEEEKRKILLYADTMQGDYIQAVQDYNASNYGDLYWEFVGPEDDRTCSACLDLLSICYFTNSQRKQAEQETASERQFGCRHTFQQITKEDYLAQPQKNYLEYHDIPNQERVQRIRNS